MSLKEKSEKLKEIMSHYDTKWLLGDLSFVMHSGRERAADQLGQLSSPMRQLYYLAGLNISSPVSDGLTYGYDPEEWKVIAGLLNAIESDYAEQLMAETGTDKGEWEKVRNVAVPSFLSYFNEGPLNFEEQILNWVIDLYTNFDTYLEQEYGLQVIDFVNFYNNLDQLGQGNFQAFTMSPELLREDWEDYTNIKSGMDENLPAFFRDSVPKEYLVMSKFMIDKGMKDRFYPSELALDGLTEDKVKIILGMLSCRREQRDFTFYTETKPGNPLYDFPIMDLENGMYQVFEVKQVIHAINNFLERDITRDAVRMDRYLKLKGDLLEDNIVKLLSDFLGEGTKKVYQSYFVKGKEQDILILWNDYALIIEAKGYNLREPFRNPEKAFVRISDDFKKCIGYGYEQTSRVESIILSGDPLVIEDKDGGVIEQIDTACIKEAFSIIVNQHSFGLVQNDLSYLLNVGEEDIYPWAVTFEDLEIFILTLTALKKSPQYFFDFLLFREELHGKVRCSDELEICGGYLTGKINAKRSKYQQIIKTLPEFGDIFDDQYRKGMGFKNEKYLEEKLGGRHMFW